MDELVSKPTATKAQQSGLAQQEADFTAEGAPPPVASRVHRPATHPEPEAHPGGSAATIPGAAVPAAITDVAAAVSKPVHEARDLPPAKSPRD
jgi:hypothetical protein